MANRYKNRSGSCTAAQGGANGFAAIHQWLPVAAFIRWLPVASDQPSFANPYGRQVCDHAQMTGQAEAPGMGIALTVAENEIGPKAQTFQRIQYGGHFAKRQQARDVRKTRGTPDYRRFDFIEVGKLENRYSSAGSPVMVFKTDVRAGDIPDILEVIIQNNSICQAYLYCARLRGRNIPLMQSSCKRNTRAEVRNQSDAEN